MGTWASVDPQLLELSDDGRTVTRLAPRNLHEHACALGGTVLREGCHRWDVELDHSWEDLGGLNLCVGVAAAHAVAAQGPLLPVPTGFPDQGIQIDAQGVASLELLQPGEKDQGEEWDAWPTEEAGAAEAEAGRPAAAPAASGSAEPMAWGLNPFDASLYTCADARCWGQDTARSLRPKEQPAVRASRVTVIVDMGPPPRAGAAPPRRTLSFAINGGPEVEANVELPAAVVAWVLTHHAGDAVRLGPCERLTRAAAGESAAPTEARARWAELSAAAEAEEGSIRATWGEKQRVVPGKQALVEELVGAPGLSAEMEAMLSEEEAVRAAEAKAREEARNVAAEARALGEAHAMELESGAPPGLGTGGLGSPEEGKGEEEDDEEGGGGGGGGGGDGDGVVAMQTPYARRKLQARLAAGLSPAGEATAGGWRFRSWFEADEGGEVDLSQLLQETAALFGADAAATAAAAGSAVSRQAGTPAAARATTPAAASKTPKSDKKSASKSEKKKAARAEGGATPASDLSASKKPKKTPTKA